MRVTAFHYVSPVRGDTCKLDTTKSMVIDGGSGMHTFSTFE
jgi:hypothetical protein